MVESEKCQSYMNVYLVNLPTAQLSPSKQDKKMLEKCPAQLPSSSTDLWGLWRELVQMGRENTEEA